MCKAYNWAFLNPLRKIFYNITTTGLSVAVALLVGTIELLQVLIGMLACHGQIFSFIAALDFGILGYLIVGMFLVAWGLSVAFGHSAASSSVIHVPRAATRTCMFTKAAWCIHTNISIRPQTSVSSVR